MSLLCFTLLFFLFFFKQSLQRISVKLPHDAGVEGDGWLAGRVAAASCTSVTVAGHGESVLGGVCFGSVMRASSPRPLSAETETVAGG